MPTRFLFYTDAWQVLFCTEHTTDLVDRSSLPLKILAKLIQSVFVHPLTPCLVSHKVKVKQTSEIEPHLDCVFSGK